MKKMICFGALCASVLSTSALAEFELTFDMAGTTIEDGAFVYGAVADANEYAGRDILGIGVRDLQVSFLAESEITFGWALDLSNAGYGSGIFIFASEGPFPSFASETFDMEFDISGYDSQMLWEDAYGDWNGGTFVGSNGVNDAFTVTSGEMYYVLDGEAVPAPGALALVGLAGLVARRRRS